MQKISITLSAFLFLVLSTAKLNAAQPSKQKLRTSKMQKVMAAQSAFDTYKTQSQLFETWLPWANKWRNSDKQMYYYNSLQSLALNMDQNWDTVSNKWINNTLDSFVYDNLDRPAIHITQVWGNGIFTNASKITDSFSGNVKTETVYGFDNTNLLAQYRDVFYLDNNGNDTLDINQGWDGSAWVNSVMYSLQYSTASQVTSILTSQWTGNKWQLTDREQNYYDAQSTDTLYVHQSLDANSGKWQYVFVQESKNSYNAGQLIQSIQNGSYNNIHFMPFAKYDYSYDATGNDSQYTIQIWDSIGKTWVNNGRYTFTYQVFTGIDRIDADNGLKVYPNPSTNDLNFEYSLSMPGHTTIRIFDLAGREVSTVFNGNENAGKHCIRWSGVAILTSGVYLYTITSNNYSVRGKIIVK